MKTVRGHLALLLTGVVLLGHAATAQNVPRQIDIGAAEAPLTDGERNDLASAIAAHNYAAEKLVIDHALAANPASRELQILAGRLAYLENHPADAVESFQRADKIKPLSNEDRMTLALAYEFADKPATARAELVRLTKGDPKNPQYLYLLGRVDAKDQKLEQAVESFRSAIKLDPDFMRAYDEMGRAQETLGLVDEARKSYEAQVQRNRLRQLRWEWAPVNLGILLEKDGKEDEAEKLFAESLQYKPTFAWAHYYLGQVYQKKHRDMDAVAEYKSAVVNDRGLRQAWLALGREYTRLGQKDEADRALAIFQQLEDRENARRLKR
jgi:tetratricopeptide (TPR) repeat protein